MRLEIRHITRYRYGLPVTDSVNEIRLTPRTDERQACYHHNITIEPNVSIRTYEDFFGNRVHSFTANALHRELAITAESTVVTRNRNMVAGLGNEPDNPWGKIASQDFVNQYAEYLLPTSYISFHPAIQNY